MIYIERLPEEDWNADWSRAVKPVRIGRRTVIRPSWERASLKPGDIELILDPKRAFGTGHHATTQLLIEWLEDIIRGGEQVLDAGTGSGILAMVALRLGARSAVGIDCDAVAVDCAMEYAAANGFGTELELRRARLEDVGGRRFDVVLANLDRRTLLQSVGPLLGHLHAGAVLLLSGLLAQEEDAVRAAFADAGCRLKERREREGWIAFHAVPTTDTPC